MTLGRHWESSEGRQRRPSRLCLPGSGIQYQGRGGFAIIAGRWVIKQSRKQKKKKKKKKKRRKTSGRRGAPVGGCLRKVPGMGHGETDSQAGGRFNTLTSTPTQTKPPPNTPPKRGGGDGQGGKSRGHLGWLKVGGRGGDNEPPARMYDTSVQNVSETPRGGKRQQSRLQGIGAALSFLKANSQRKRGDATRLGARAKGKPESLWEERPLKGEEGKTIVRGRRPSTSGQRSLRASKTRNQMEKKKRGSKEDSEHEKTSEWASSPKPGGNNPGGEKKKQGGQPGKYLSGNGGIRLTAFERARVEHHWQKMWAPRCAPKNQEKRKGAH